MVFINAIKKYKEINKKVSVIAIVAMLFSVVPSAIAIPVPPVLTITINPSHITQAQDATITIESDKSLVETPTIVVEKPDESTMSVDATETATNTWTGACHIDSSMDNGTYTVTVTGEDDAAQTATETATFDIAFGFIEGTVYDGTAETTVALENCEVQLYDQADNSPPINFSFSDEPGNKYKFKGLTPGTYWVQALRTDALPTKAASAKTQVTVSENSTSTVGLALRNPSLTGTVVDPNGDPVAEVRVEAHNKDYTVSVDDMTDNNGKFALAPVSSDTYGIVARPRLDSGYANSETKVMSLGASTQALSNPLVLREIMITGQILPPTGSTGVSDVGVMIHNEDWSYQEESFTDNGGNYYFGGITPGSYKIEAFPGPDSVYCQATPTDITITGDTQTVDAIRLTLPSITGTVSNPDDTGSPAAGSFVEVHNDNWSICMGSPVNENGEYQIGGLPEGAYKIRANPGPSSPYSSSAENTVTVNSDSIQSIDMTLTAPVIVGKVVDNKDQAVRDANVALHDSNWQTVYFSQPTSNNGRFALGGISAGIYELEINPPWERPDLIRPSPLTIEVSANSTFTVTDGECTTTTINGVEAIQIAFAKASKTIQGNVTKTGGSPIANAQVFAFKEQGCGFANTMTKSDGSYSLGVSGGKWRVSVEPNKDSTTTVDWAYTGQPKPATFDESSTPETKTVDFEVSAASVIVTGRILAPDGTTTVHQAHVEIRNASGLGNGGEPDGNGEFSINVPAGTYKLMTFLPPDSPYGSAKPQTITTNETGTVDAGDIMLTTKNSQIKGIIKGPSGQGINNATVNAMQPNGGFTQTTTGSDGTFTLNVSAGTWEVMLEPTSEASYVYSGPPKRVTVKDNEIKAGITFSVVYADSTIQGRVVNGGGDTMTDLYGFACATNEYGGYGGPLEAGRFELSVPAGTYNVSGGFPPGTPYSLSTQNNIEVATGESKVVELTVVENDRTISGIVLDSDGDTITASDLFVEVFAMSDGGSFQHAVAEKNDITGAWEYSLPVSDGNWRIGYFVDKSSGYLGRPPVDQDSAIVVNGDETYNITLYSASANISGRVTDPDGNGLPYVFVFSQEPKGDKDSGRSRFFTDTMTDVDGYYSLGVPAGSYEVGSGMPPSKMKSSAYVYPELQNVTVADAETETVNIQYGSADSAIAGSVTLNGNGVNALVWAWSENGRYAETDAGDNGSYSMPVKGNETWHVGARYKDEGGFYLSDETEVDVTANGTETVNLALTASTVSIPDAVSITFSSGEMKIIELSNGTKIQIPAGAIASSGNITVIAQPEVGLRKQKDSQPIGIGYELTALDSNGQPISDFISAVTITLPYDPNDLPEGVTANDLVPAYWDENSGTWQKVDSAVVDGENHTISIQVTHFSLWGNIAKATVSDSSSQQNNDDVNTSGGSSSESISAPTGLDATAIPSENIISVSWNAGSASSLAGYYLYRSLTDSIADAVKIATIGKETTSYDDNAITDGDTYYYWLSAYDTSDNESSKTGPASAVAGQVEVSFADLSDTHWAKQYVSALVSKGIVSGYGDNTFRPLKTVTRAEFAKMICLAKGWELSVPSKPSFKDMTNDNWAFSYIETAKTHGVIIGYKDGSFRPGSHITRAEIAKVVATSQGLKIGSSNLTDINDSWAKDYINACVQAGIISGYGNGKFKPAANATRAEAAKMIFMMIK